MLAEKDKGLMGQFPLIYYLSNQSPMMNRMMIQTILIYSSQVVWAGEASGDRHVGQELR